MYMVARFAIQVNAGNVSMRIGFECKRATIFTCTCLELAWVAMVSGEARAINIGAKFISNKCWITCISKTESS